MNQQEHVWLNGEMLPLAQARVSVEDRGFLYGDGFFETMRADRGRVSFLTRHVQRLKASAEAFKITFTASIPWEDHIRRLLAVNGLSAGPAAVKILLTRGMAPGLGMPPAANPTLVIYARAYEPPTPEEYAAGWPVATFPERRTTFVGRHKSLNYLFYLAARQYALERGAREAIVLEADGQVSEGAATSLIVAREGGYFTPESPSALAGVTLAVLAEALRKRGRELQYVKLKRPELRKTEGLWLANSLIGLMPVAAVDGKPLPQFSAATRYLQDCLAEMED